MELIPDNVPFVAQVALGASYGAVAAVVGGIALYWLGRLLVLAPPEPLERLYARVRAPGRVTSVGRHSLAARAGSAARGTPTVVMQAVE